MSDLIRCNWVGKEPIYQEYHDLVWGRPVKNGQTLFAKLCLDGQQAGLSWITILKKQQNYEQAFHDFDPVKIATMGEADIEQQMQNAGIVRNRLKIQSIIRNAKAFLAMAENGEEFSHFIWQFVDHKVVTNAWQSHEQVPITTAQSDAMAKALKKRGFNFVGSTICYAFMQAVGLVNDHIADCHCYQPCKQLAKNI